MVVSITEVKQMIIKELEEYKKIKDMEIAEEIRLMKEHFVNDQLQEMESHSLNITIKALQIDAATKKEELLEDAVSRYQELITTVLYLCAECTNIFKFWEGKNFDEILHDLATFERFLQNKNY